MNRLRDSILRSRSGGVTQCTSGPEDYNLSQINRKPKPHPPAPRPPEMVRRGFILDSVQNRSCVRAMLLRNTVSVGLKLIPRLTAASLAQLGERAGLLGGGGDEYCQGGW